jgi:hypothetical protein
MVPNVDINMPVQPAVPPIIKISEISASICPEAIAKPTAIAKSKIGFSFGRSAGAKLTVSRLAGKSKPELRSAERTLSLASSTDLSAKPTMKNAGNPAEATSTSTETGNAESPIVVPEVNFANILNPEQK